MVTVDFLISGASATDLASRGMSAGGDINGDGLSDILIELHKLIQMETMKEQLMSFSANRTHLMLTLFDVENGIGGSAINGFIASEKWEERLI